jgi:hypothetical protein
MAKLQIKSASEPASGNDNDRYADNFLHDVQNSGFLP